MKCSITVGDWIKAHGDNKSSSGGRYHPETMKTSGDNPTHRFQSDRLLWNSGPMWQSTLSWFSSRLASKSKAGSMRELNHDSVLCHIGPEFQSNRSDWKEMALLRLLCPPPKSKAGSMGRIVTGSLHGFGVVPATAAGFVISMCSSIGQLRQ
jgi:hypothetical protein